ncbi:hypothetical protein M3Y98_00233800 [Aphelenchoides besseyi]|nr:hypothetical protein M3Y98_00233800 [Aphelenchoides besseyi]KAI6200613.1 hypothetical protein M3Y96_00752500 [Aphelenchoides besseyi]
MNGYFKILLFVSVICALVDAKPHYHKNGLGMDKNKDGFGQHINNSLGQVTPDSWGQKTSDGFGQGLSHGFGQPQPNEGNHFGQPAPLRVSRDSGFGQHIKSKQHPFGQEINDDGLDNNNHFGQAEEKGHLGQHFD